MTILRNGVSSMVVSTRAAVEFKSPAKLRIQASGPQCLDFLQFGLPTDLHKGANILTATLRIYQTTAWPGGAITLTARRLAAPWKLSTVNYSNRPVTAAGTEVAVSKSNTPANGVWEFNVAADVQAWVNGSARNYGWQLSTSSTISRYIWGFAAPRFKPTLEITYTYGPVPPTSLNPSFGAVSVAKPYLDFTAGDFEALRVQVDPAANATTPAFDSGWVTTQASEFNLATSTYPGLANLASTQWRVQVRDDAGRASDWSQWATFSRINKPTLTISQPTGTVTEASPPIVFDMAGLTDWQVLIAEASKPSVYIYDSGKKHSTIGQHTPTKVITKNGASYIVTVRAWDAVEREGMTGDPKYVQASVTTTLAYSSTVTGVDWLTLDQANPTPWVDVKWSRAIQPDAWAILRDGDTVEIIDTANDALVSGTVYVWRDMTVAPNREHVYRVLPIVNGVTGSVGPEDTITPTGAGLWLVDPETGDAAVIWGNEAGTWAHGSDVTVYNPIGASASVRVTNSLRGLEGSLSGVLLDTSVAEDFTVDAVEAMLWDWKGQPDMVLRLVAGDINIPVNVFDLSLFPDPQTDASDRIVNVAFGFSQTGELPFESDL